MLFYFLKDIPRREKYHTEKPKRSNVYRAPGMSDSRKELQDSLPLCHPHDDYLKDFNPMNRKLMENIENKLVSYKSFLNLLF